jgi:Peptidase C39 family
MQDLVLASCILAFVSLGMFVIVARLARRLPRRLCDALAAGVVILMGFYTRDVWDQMIVAEWLPYSSLIILGNWFPLGIGALAGLAWERVPPPLARRVFAVLMLFGSAAYSVYYPFRGEVPECKDRWRRGVCLQTTQATCSAASAATLLRVYDIATTEQEMAELCVTRQGTSWWGLYRGLKLKTAGTKWDVQVVSGTASELQASPDQATIIFVRLTADAAEENPRYLDEGWIVGTSHAVVLFGIHEDGTCLIGDPSSGREVWSRKALELLYQGRGMRLVKAAL